jgi:hypothetical protein
MIATTDASPSALSDPSTCSRTGAKDLDCEKQYFVTVITFTNNNNNNNVTKP